MSSFLDLVVFMLFAPFVLIALAICAAARAIAEVFEPITLCLAAWCGWGAYLLSESASGPDRPFVSIVELIARASIGHITTPIAFLILAGVLMAVSASVAYRRRSKR